MIRFTYLSCQLCFVNLTTNDFCHAAFAFSQHYQSTTVWVRRQRSDWFWLVELFLSFYALVFFYITIDHSSVFLSYNTVDHDPRPLLHTLCYKKLLFSRVTYKKFAMCFISYVTAFLGFLFFGCMSPLIRGFKRATLRKKQIHQK